MNAHQPSNARTLNDGSIEMALKVGANNNQKRPPPRLRQFSPSRALSRGMRRKSCNQALGLRVVGAGVQEFCENTIRSPYIKRRQNGSLSRRTRERGGTYESD